MSRTTERLQTDEGATAGQQSPLRDSHLSPLYHVGIQWGRRKAIFTMNTASKPVKTIYQWRNPYNEALRLAKLGLRVVPLFGTKIEAMPACTCKLRSECKNIGKHPIPARWPEVATTDPVQIDQWFNYDFQERRERPNLGIAREPSQESLSSTWTLTTVGTLRLRNYWRPTAIFRAPGRRARAAADDTSSSSIPATAVSSAIPRPTRITRS